MYELTAHSCHEVRRLSRSPEETRALGRAVGRHAEPGDLITLRGDLGAGKTVLVQGMAEGMDISGPVVSPSFTLIHEHAGRLKLYHLDLYRLATPELPEIGIDEVLGGDAVVAVEWSERLPRVLQGDALEIELTHGEEDDTAQYRVVRGGTAGEETAGGGAC